MSLSLGSIRDEQNSPIPQHHAVVVRGFEQHSEPLPHVEVVQTTDAGSLPSLAAFSVSLLLTPPPPSKKKKGNSLFTSLLYQLPVQEILEQYTVFINF